MSNADRFQLNGKIIQKLKGDKFLVELENGVVATGTISGKLRINCIKLVVGDIVTVDVSPYSIESVRIIWREKNPANNNNTSTT